MASCNAGSKAGLHFNETNCIFDTISNRHAVRLVIVRLYDY